MVETTGMHTEFKAVEKPITLGDLYEFIQTHKGTKTFVNMSDKEIVDDILLAITNKTLYYHTVNGKIVGMILATIDREHGILYINQNLAMNLNILKLFAKKAKQDFAGFNLQWRKNNILKMHNTDKVYDKLAR